MKITLAAVGRLGASVENGLAKDYLKRAHLTGRALGFSPIELVEVETKKSLKSAASEVMKAQEAQAISEALGEGCLIIACDERGLQLTSREIALRLERFKDQGERKLAFVIGGADGLDPEWVAKSRLSLGFGPQTWPHALIRAMVAEQIYRSMTLLAGLPYHRD